MPELFGAISNENVYFLFSWNLDALKNDRRGRSWGLAFYRDGYWSLIKEPRKLHESTLLSIGENKSIYGSAIISHLRLATRGLPCIVNTHPFIRFLGIYERGLATYWREWAFAHKGNITPMFSSDEMPSNELYLIGETDSEYAFAILMKVLSKEPSCLLNPLETKEILEEISQKMSKYGDLDYILSDGKSLFVYTNTGRIRYAIRYPHIPVRSDIEGKFMRIRIEDTSPETRMILVAMDAKSEDEWRELKNDVVHVFHEGDILSYETLNEVERDILEFLIQIEYRVPIRNIKEQFGEECIPNLMNLIYSDWIILKEKVSPKGLSDKTLITINRKRKKFIKKST